jgi:hypothetical protein
MLTNAKETGRFEHRTCPPSVCSITARHTVSQRRLVLASQIYVMIVLLAWLPVAMGHPVQKNSEKHKLGHKPEFRLPLVLEEWAALIPLMIYLESSFHHDYQCAGESALTCKLSVGIFPKLWAIGSVTKLLRDRENFLDMAITSGPPLLCLDVQWGNALPCANSAATAAIAQYVLSSREGKHISIDDLSSWTRSGCQKLARRLSIKGSDFDSKTVPALLNQRLGRQRKQTLQVLRFSKKDGDVHPRRRRRSERLEQSVGCAEVFAATCLTAALVVTGNYGSGALVFLAGITRSLSRSVVLERPESYLHSDDDQRQRCILAGPHESASTWYLFVGDVDLIDTLLIKPMVIIPPNQSKYLIQGFSTVRVLQLLLMTYVASQKQWDGICLVILVMLAIVIEKLMGDTRHARDWLEGSGYTCETVTCEFAGRHDLMGAVQCIAGGKETAWMDKVLQIARRRTVWLGKIRARWVSREKLAKEYQALSPFDREWVDSTAMMSFAGGALIKEALGISVDSSS